MQYRILTGSHGRFEGGKHTRYTRGDLIDLSPAEVAALGARVEPVSGVAAAVSDSAASAEPIDAPAPAPGSSTEMAERVVKRRRGRPRKVASP